MADRFKSVLWFDSDHSFIQISELLFIDEQTARRHVREFLETHKSRNDSGGSGGMLSPEQCTQLKDALNATAVPSAQTAAEIAKDLFGIRFSVSGMTDWLKRQGFSFKKNEPRPAKADPLAQATFITQYEDMRQRLSEEESIFFLDACHPTRATKVAYSWSLKGERKCVKTYAGRERVNVVGSLDVTRMKLVTSFPEKTNGDSLSDHLKQLRRASKTQGVIHLILDNGSYCRSEIVRQTAEALKINLVFLPPYSPNLNLIERLWRLMNEEVRNNVCFATKAEFETAIKDFFQKRWRSLKHTCKNLFVERFQIFESPAF